MTYTQLLVSSTLGQVIKSYRETCSNEQLRSQEAVAEAVGVSSRRIRDWENGEEPRIHPKNARKLHETIGIPLKFLGINGEIRPDELYDLHKRVRRLMDHGAYTGVFVTSQLLIEEYNLSNGQGWKIEEYILPSAYLTLGMATATLTNDPQQALEKFVLMESEVRASKDIAAIALAQTSQAEMYRRLGKPEKALKIHQRVEKYLFPGQRYTGLDALIAGNSRQMTARTLLSIPGNEKVAFDYLLQAKELASEAVPQEGHNYYLCFGPLSIQAEYVKASMLSGKDDEGFKQIEEMNKLAEYASPRWKVQVNIKEGEFNIRAGRRKNNNSMKDKGAKLLLQGYKEAIRIQHTRQQDNANRLLGELERENDSNLKQTKELREQFNELEREKAKPDPENDQFSQEEN